MSQQIRVEQIDTETGEVVSLVAVKPFKGPHPFKREGFVQMSQLAMMELAQHPVSGEARRVLDAFCAVLDFENFIQISLSDLAKLIGMEKQNVSRAVRELVERGIVVKGVKVGRSFTYRLSPTFGFKGRGSNFQKLMSDVSDFSRRSTDQCLRDELEALGQLRLTK